MGKYHEIMDYIRVGMATGKFEPDSKLPSETMLMQRFGVSRIVAVNALNNLAQTGEIYRIHGKGSFAGKNPRVNIGPLGTIRKTAPRQISFILQGYNDSFSCNLANAIQRAALAENIFCPLHISVADKTPMSQDIENSLIQFSIHNSAEALIIFPSSEDIYNKELQRLSENKFPVILLDRELLGSGFPCVQTDHAQMGKLAAEICLNAGHKSLAYFSATGKIKPSDLRYSGFEKRAKEEKGMASFQSIIIDKKIVKSDHVRLYQIIFDRLTDLLKAGVTALVSNVSVISVIILGLMNENPDFRNFSVLSMDEPNSKNVIAPSYIGQDFNKIASTAIEVVCDYVKHPRKDGKTFKVPPVYIDNGTVKKI